MAAVSTGSGTGTAGLTVTFLGVDRVLEPGDSLTFGRAADLVIDDNRYLNRVVGRFSSHEGVWWLENLSAHVELELIADPGMLVRLSPGPPGAVPPLAPLPGGPSVLDFEVAGARYELEVLAPARTGGPTIGGGSDDGTETLGYGRIDLTDEELAMVVRLAEPVLRDRGSGSESGQEAPSSSAANVRRMQTPGSSSTWSTASNRRVALQWRPGAAWPCTTPTSRAWCCPTSCRPGPWPTRRAGH